MEDRERRGTILALLYRTKYFDSNYPLAGELRIRCMYIMTGTLLVHELQR